MQNVGLSLIDTLILVCLSIVAACFFAALGGLIRHVTRNPSGVASVVWLMRLGIFVGIPFSIIGMTSGYLTGLSRVGAISGLVPASLALLGGVAAYLFGKGGKSAVMAAFAVVNFSVMTLLGGLIGGRERVETEQAQQSLDYKMDQIKQEFVIKQFRHGLGLDEPANSTPAKTDTEKDPAGD
jgi:apolipoprotein N-acyltransferase